MIDIASHVYKEYNIYIIYISLYKHIYIVCMNLVDNNGVFVHVRNIAIYYNIETIYYN